MHATIPRMLSVMAIFTIAGGALAQSPADGNPVNVRDYGAKGDGGADDTKAVQAAFDAAGKAFPWPEVYFPAGNYKITDTLKTYSTTVRGRNATITQATPDKDILYYDFSWRTTIEGMSFKGGAKQLNLGNNFVDQGLILIQDCRFIESTDFAIYLDRRSYATHLVIKNCVFSVCAQTLYTIADWTTLSDSWITSHAQMKNQAVIEARGAKLECDNIVGVPLVSGIDQRWIDAYGNVTCHNFRFGGEFGGFTPVVNWYKGGNIVLEDCCAWADANPKRHCAVYCEEIPGGLYIRNCFLAIPPVLMKPELDLKRAFDHIPEGMVRFDVLDNNGPFMDDPGTKAILQAIAKRDKSLPPIAGAATRKQVKADLARAVATVRALPGDTPEKPLESQMPQQQWHFKPHTQKLNPADYTPIRFDPKTWDLDERMDNQLYLNRQFVALAPAGDRVVFMRKAPGLHPHIAIRHVMVDLDKTPFMTWKLADPGVKMPSGHAVKVILEETNQMRLLLEHSDPTQFFTYNAVDLREAFNLPGGRHALTIRFYVLANDQTPDARLNQAGDYLVLDFLRTERE